MSEGDRSWRQVSATALWGAAILVVAYYLLGWGLGWGTGMKTVEPTMPLLLAVNIFRHIVRPLVISGLIFACSASAGLLLLSLLRFGPGTPLERLLLGTLVGLGVAAYATLAMGSAGLLDRTAFLAVLALMLIVGLSRLRRTLHEVRIQASEWISTWHWFDCALALLGSAVLVIALLSVGTPVLDYDTLEYHLGGPGEYFAAGRISFLRHNVYASFPAHVEMLYLMGITLAGGKTAGMGAALMTQAMFGLLAVALVGCIAARFVRREAGLPAAVFLLCCPMLILTVVRGHITLARCAYKTGALLAVMSWLYGPPKERSAWLMLAGLCCGLGVAVKYTAAATLCLPMGALVLGVSLVRNRGWRARLAAPVALAALALLAAMPWFVRNAVATGNPVHPLLHGLFRSGEWSAEQAAKFACAHAPGSLALVPRNLWRFLTAYRGGTFADFANPVAVIFIPVLLVMLLRRPTGQGERRGPIAVLGAYAAAFALIWGVATHGIARFMAPSVVALCILSAAGLCAVGRNGRPAVIVRALALLCCCYGVFAQAAKSYAWGGLGASLGGEGLPELVRELDLKGVTEYAEAVEWTNKNLPLNARLMLVGEARIYHFERPLLYSVVFNDHPIEPALALAGDDPAAGAQLLRGTGADGVLVNWFELRRLATSYSYTLDGRRRPGYLPDLDWRTRAPLKALLDKAGTRVMAFGTMPWPQDDSRAQKPVIEIYRLHP